MFLRCHHIKISFLHLRQTPPLPFSGCCCWIVLNFSWTGSPSLEYSIQNLWKVVKKSPDGVLASMMSVAKLSGASISSCVFIYITGDCQRLQSGAGNHMLCTKQSLSWKACNLIRIRLNKSVLQTLRRNKVGEDKGNSYKNIVWICAHQDCWE